MANPTLLKDCGVFHDANRRTCIRVGIDRKYTRFIQMSVIEIGISRLLTEEFDQEWSPLLDYTPQRAAERFLFRGPGVVTEITPEAASLLRLIAGPAYKRADLTQDPPSDILKPQPPKEVADMATEKKAPAKRPAAKKSAEAPAGKVAPAKKAAAPKAKAKADADPKERGRAPNVAGSAKIKLLTEKGANPKRAAAAERFALYKNGMTVDEYIALGGKRADVNWDISQGFIEVK